MVKQPAVRRLTLIIRLQSYQAAQGWCGQVETVNPHREAVFRSRDELWRLLEAWTASSAVGKDEQGGHLNDTSHQPTAQAE
jgi:hypothetical protein